MEKKALKFVKLLSDLTNHLKIRDLNLKYCEHVGSIECLLLQFLHTQEEHQNMNQLSKYLHVSYSRVTRIVDGLVAKGLVIRVNSKEDRRKWFVHLTSKGEEISEKISKRILENQIEALSYIEKEKLDTIYSSLVTYRDAVRKSVEGFTKTR